jgi:hypothetical protein
MVPLSGNQRGVLRCGLIPSDDTFVDNIFPNRQHGQSPGDLPNLLIVRDTPDLPERTIEYTYLKFDLPRQLPREIVASGAVPVNATLWLYVRYVSIFYDASIEVHRVVNNDWSESTLTWSNKPSFDKASSSVQTITANGTWFPWNVLGDVGRSMREKNPISMALTTVGPSWASHVMFDSKDHPQPANMSTRPELDLSFVPPTLTIQAPYSDLPITIEGQTYGTNANGTFQANVPWGSYRISVPEVIPISESSRAVFIGWSDHVAGSSRVITIGSDMTLGVSYRVQHRLDVTSPYGSTNGSGWYFDNMNATSSVTPSVIPAEGLAGMIGVRHVFDHWTGDCIGSKPECDLVMDSPKRVAAVWRDDYTITIAALISIGVVGALVFALLSRRGKTRNSTRRSGQENP